MAEAGESPRMGRDLWVLTVEQACVGGIVVLAASGRIGLAGAPELVAACARVIGEGHRRVLLDLGGVDYISSPGLAALQQVHALARQAGAAFAACCLTEPVRIAIDLAGLSPVFSIETSRAAAVTRLCVEGG